MRWRKDVVLVGKEVILENSRPEARADARPKASRLSENKKELLQTATSSLPFLPGPLSFPALPHKQTSSNAKR